MLVNISAWYVPKKKIAHNKYRDLFGLVQSKLALYVYYGLKLDKCSPKIYIANNLSSQIFATRIQQWDACRMKLLLSFTKNIRIFSQQRFMVRCKGLRAAYGALDAYRGEFWAQIGCVVHMNSKYIPIQLVQVKM